MKKLFLGALAIAAAGAAAAGSLYDFTAESIGGSTQALSAYRGQVVLIVNTASRCGFTRQYAGIQRLYEKYQERGLVVLGFPANNFGGQEPGSNQEIRQFCTERFQVTFPLFEKISVKGADRHPLYAWLTSHPNGAAVSWNFNKFLVGRDGDLIAHFGSWTGPESKKLISAIEKALDRPAP